MVAEAIAPIGATPFAGLLPWLTSLVEKLRAAVTGQTATHEERELLNLAEFVALRFGDPLLQATSLDDLDDRLDALVGSPDALYCTALLARLVPVVQASEPVSAEGFANTVGEHLGPAQGRLLMESEVVLDAWLDAQRQAAALITHQPAVGPERVFSFSLAALEVPAELTELVFHSLRASFCSMAIVHAVSSKKRLDPWLARGLVERMIESVTKHLRLLASLPGVSVDESLVPSSLRLNLQAIAERHERARTTARRTLEATRARLAL